MDKSDLVEKLRSIEARIDTLPEFSYDSSLSLQKLLDEFCSHREYYVNFDLPNAPNFGNQIYEIEKNIAGLTMDDKGRDLAVFKEKIFNKSKKDLIIFIHLYTDHLLSPV